MILTLVRTLTHNNGVYWAAFSHDGKRLATASLDNLVKLWNPSTGEHTGTLKGHADGVTFVEFLKDGRIVSAGLDRNVRIWSAEGESKMIFAGHQQYLACAAVTRSGSLIASGGFDATVRLYDPQAGVAGAVLNGHEGNVQALAFSGDGSVLASGGDDLSIRLWDMETKTLKAKWPGHSATVEALAWSPKDDRLVSGGADGLLRFWSPDGTAAVVPSRSPKVKSIGFSADGRWLAAGGTDGTVRVWNAASRTEAAAQEKAHINTVYGVAFSPDGSLLATASFDRTIRLWKVET